MGKRSSRHTRAGARADNAGNCAGEQSIARTIPRRPRGPDHRGDGEKDGGPVDDPRSEAHPIRPQGPPRDLLSRSYPRGLPVVSTPLGAEGLGARDGENLLLAASGPAFAEAASRLDRKSTRLN